MTDLIRAFLTLPWVIPVPFLAAGFIALSGVLVLVHGKQRALGAACTALALALALCWVAVLEMIDGTPFAQVLFCIIGVELLCFSLCLFSFCLYTIVRGHVRNPSVQVAYLVVHGAGLAGKEPSRLLARRLDAAREMWDRQGRAGLIVVSGGQGPDEEVSEAQAMRAYLERAGVPPASILEEGRSRSTWENIVMSHALMRIRENRGDVGPIALVTSDFHVLRCWWYAYEAGIDAHAIAAPSPPLSWLRSVVREFLALNRYVPRMYAAVGALVLVAVLLG